MTNGPNNPPTSFLFVDHYFSHFFSSFISGLLQLWTIILGLRAWNLRYAFNSRALLFMGFSIGCKTSTSPTPQISWEKHAYWASYRAIMVNSWLPLLEWSKLSFTLQPPTIYYLSLPEWFWAAVTKWETVLLDLSRARYTSPLRLPRVQYSPQVPSLERLWSHHFWLQF